MRTTGFLFILFLLVSSQTYSQVINLEGSWKFHIDDKEYWAMPNFDDSKWEFIHAPSPWENEGFNGYDGFAWYRRKFDGKRLDKNESYYLGLGYIDDCDEVYLNGKLIGFSGSMPPHFKTSYNSERKYPVPADAINFSGENTIAIRVYDVTQGGGIVDGDLGIYRIRYDQSMVVDLRGVWSFATCWDEQPIKNQKDWRKIMVPEPWERQGFKYDGYAWYKRTFTLPANAPTKDLVLLLGKIDDFDKAYLNGTLIGTTNDHREYGRSGSYEKLRVYDIPPDLLKKSGLNVLEVLVEDMGNWGGIYEGPVGIVTRENYLSNFR